MDSFPGVESISIYGILPAGADTMVFPVMVLIIFCTLNAVIELIRLQRRKGNICRYDIGNEVLQKGLLLTVVLVGLGMDWLVAFMVAYLGIHIRIPAMIGVLAVIWMICNELICILENLNKMGVELPPFLVTVVKRVRVKLEDDIAEKAEEQNEKNGNGMEVREQRRREKRAGKAKGHSGKGGSRA